MVSLDNNNLKILWKICIKSNYETTGNPIIKF